MRKLKLSHLTRKMGKSECEPASVRSRPVSDLASERPGKPSPLLKDEGGFSRYLAEFSGEYAPAERTDPQTGPINGIFFPQASNCWKSKSDCLRMRNLRNRESLRGRPKFARELFSTREMNSRNFDRRRKVRLYHNFPGIPSYRFATVRTYK